jgi:hypothetical protein
MVNYLQHTGRFAWNTKNPQVATCGFFIWMLCWQGQCPAQSDGRFDTCCLYAYLTYAR